MAVFTSLDKNDIQLLITPYGIGNVVDFQGIGDGMENTNYFVTTSSNHLADDRLAGQQGQYVLTIFEELPESHIPFHLALLETLASHHLPVAHTLKDYNGQAIQHYRQKPCILSTRLIGTHPREPNIKQCHEIGKTLANLHLAAGNIKDTWHGTRNNEWLSQCVSTVSNQLDDNEKVLVTDLLKQFLILSKDKELAAGIIHGDLFRDNAMFQNDTLTGIIDFYNAGDNFLSYDLAIVVNDWCTDENQSINEDRYYALIDAYQEVRPLSDKEKDCWPLMLQIAAMRFWLSRLLNQRNNAGNQHELLELKDPEEFKNLLIHYRKGNIPKL